MTIGITKIIINYTIPPPFLTVASVVNIIPINHTVVSQYFVSHALLSPTDSLSYI